MSKNLTRKGLAFGAAVALSSTLFAGTPAFAADELTLAPKLGTSYKTIESEAFTLTAAAAPATSQANIGQLKYQVVSTAAFTASAGAGNVTLDTTNASDTTSAASATQPANTKVFKADNAAVAGYQQTIALTSPAVAAGTPVTATVTAFWDANANDVLDSGEFTSPARTVTWVDVADVKTTTEIVAPVAGDTTIVAKVSFDDINNEQLTKAAVGVYFTKGDGSTLYPQATLTAASQATTVRTYTGANNFVAGQTVTVAGLTTNSALNGAQTIATASATGFTTTASTATVNSVTEAGTATVSADSQVRANVTWSATDKFKFTSQTITALVAAGGVKATPVYEPGAGSAPEATDTIGTAVTATVGTRAANDITGSVVASSEALPGSPNKVKTDGTVVVEALVEDDTNGATTADPVSGQKVTAKVEVFANDGTTAKTLSSTVFVEVNGVKYTDGANLPGYNSDAVARLSLTTDSAGKAKVTIKTTGLDGTGNQAATDSVKVTFVVANLTAEEVSVDITDATYTAYALASNGNVASTTDGSAVSIPVAVYDQYGGVPATGFDVLATWDATGNYSAQATTASTAATETKAALSNGKATLSITDNGTGNGVHVYDITVQKLLGNVYQSSIASIDNFEIRIKDASTLVAGTIDYTDTGDAKTQDATTKLWKTDVANQALALTTFGAYDSRGVLGKAPASFASGSDVTIGGTLSTAATATSASVIIAGAPVTFSGAGLQFKATVDSKEIWSVGSITVHTSGTGTFDVVVYSNRSGEQTVTATSGAASSKLTIDFADAANDTGSALSVTAAKTIKAGRTLAIAGVLTDKYGNPVAVTDGTASAGAGAGNNDFTVTYDGPGYVMNTPTSTDANGKFTVRVLLGADEVGLAKLTASYDPDDAVADNTITASSTTLIGVSATLASGSKRATATVRNAEGLTIKVVSGSRTVTRVATSDSQRVSITKLRAGKRTVKVYVNDILVRSQSVTVRR
jgi:hypothetical protein